MCASQYTCICIMIQDQLFYSQSFIILSHQCVFRHNSKKLQAGSGRSVAKSAYKDPMTVAAIFSWR